MPSITAVPSTIDGIKRLAKTIKRERNVPHYDALDLASRAAGFENIRHAQRQLSSEPRRTPSAGHTIFLTAYWAKRHLVGRETLSVQLLKPLVELMAPHQVQHARNLGGFRLEFVDHLEHRIDFDIQTSAREALDAAARTLRFIEATNLVPTTSRKQNRFFSRFNLLPGRDHSSQWCDPISGAWVYLDEPYDHGLIAPRIEWARQAGLEMIAPEWEGLYAPGKSSPFFFCENLTLAERLRSQLRALPSKSLDKERPEWVGESGSYFESFVSPARAAAGKLPRPRPHPAPSGIERAGALPYGANRGGMKSLWRPSVRMPLEQHLIIGPLLQALDNSQLPAASRRAIGWTRSTLDDWLQMEFPREDEMTSEQFHETYYGKWRAPIEAPDTQCDTLERVIQVLNRHYANCAPRRELVRKLQYARTVINDKSA